jgi:hypothetical protein
MTRSLRSKPIAAEAATGMLLELLKTLIFAFAKCRNYDSGKNGKPGPCGKGGGGAKARMYVNGVSAGELKPGNPTLTLFHASWRPPVGPWDRPLDRAGRLLPPPRGLRSWGQLRSPGGKF